jgi:hypothetical protein
MERDEGSEQNLMDHGGRIGGPNPQPAIQWESPRGSENNLSGKQGRKKAMTAKDVMFLLLRVYPAVREGCSALDNLSALNVSWQRQSFILPLLPAFSVWRVVALLNVLPLTRR